MNENECLFCGHDLTWIDDVPHCPSCGIVTDIMFDGIEVDWDDLDHSHDEQ